MKFSEQAYINRVAIAGHAVVNIVLVLAYLVELLKGSRTPGYYAVFAMMCLVPIIVEVILYQKMKESDIFRRIISYTYGALYLFVIFTTTNELAFTYAFPMFMVIVLYMDVRCCVLVFSGALLGNLIMVARQAMTVGIASEELPGVEIRIAAMILTGCYMVITAKAVKKTNGAKLARIQEQNEETERLMTTVLETSDGMTSEIAQVSDKISLMGESMSRMHSAMGEVSSGSQETADSVQNQLERTEQIQENIGQVKESANLISERMEHTSEQVAEGRERMEQLASQMEAAVAANNRVLEQLRVFGEYASQMNKITEAITSIANNTGMLALNASIEAARAGEAGKGFAVVAEQISALASQTKSSTIDITELIGHINEELGSVVQAIDDVTENNRQNAESVQVVTEHFEEIKEGTDNVAQQTSGLQKIVEALEAANSDIVENIQTISAITEEVSAHASETYNACESNETMVKEAAEIAANLNQNAQKLREAR